MAVKFLFEQQAAKLSAFILVAFVGLFFRFTQSLAIICLNGSAVEMMS